MTFARSLGSSLPDFSQYVPAPRSEGPVAKAIEHETSRIPSDLFLWAACGSIVASLALHASGRKEDGQFVGMWAPTFLILGLYNKLVKVSGSEGWTRHTSIH